jgi:hypothetical protein
MPTENKPAEPLQREDRYIVIKRSDIERLPPGDRRVATRNLRDIHEEIFKAGAPARSFVVVEDDWPEYEQIWQMIERRMSGQPPVTAAEELDAVLHWRGKHDQAIKERDALQLRLNAADQRIDELIAQHQGEPAPEPKNEFGARFLRSIDSGNGQPGAFSHNSRPSAFNHENYGACAACGQTPRVYGGYQTDPFGPMVHDFTKAREFNAESAPTPGRNYTEWVNKCEKPTQKAPVSDYLIPCRKYPNQSSSIPACPNTCDCTQPAPVLVVAP